MKEPSLFYCGFLGYGMVSFEVLETVLDRNAMRSLAPPGTGARYQNIVRDMGRLLSHNEAKHPGKKRPRKENP